MAEQYGSKIGMQPINVERYEPQDKEVFLRFHGLESDRLAGSHERKGAPSYAAIKRESYRQASEMMGLGTEEYKVPVIMTGAGAAIMAHMLHGHPKEGDIITRHDRRTGLYEQEER